MKQTCQLSGKRRCQSGCTSSVASNYDKPTEHERETCDVTCCQCGEFSRPTTALAQTSPVGRNSPSKRAAVGFTGAVDGW